MALKRNLTITVLLTLFGAGASAQQNSGLVVRSNPAGAVVELKGDAIITGITPVIFAYPLAGDYGIKVSRHGYEDYRSRVTISPDNQTTLDVELKRKTKFKAAVRSMFFPGWGQRYADQKTRGLFFLVLTCSAISSYFIADHNYDIKYDRYDQRLKEYDHALANGASYPELSSRLAALDDAQSDAYDAETVRRVTIGAIGVAWGLNVLDALLFTPEETAGISVKGVTLESKSDNQTFGLSLTRKF